MTFYIKSQTRARRLFSSTAFPKTAAVGVGTPTCAKQLGFDFTAGRQDISEHPFTTNFSSEDVRITTRIDESDFGNMTWSTIHEVGHALYEQGLPSGEYGLPLGEYASLGIHEFAVSACGRIVLDEEMLFGNIITQSCSSTFHSSLITFRRNSF